VTPQSPIVDFGNLLALSKLYVGFPVTGSLCELVITFLGASAPVGCRCEATYVLP